MDVRNFLIPKREHAPTSIAKEARSTMKLVEEMLVTEFKVSSLSSTPVCKKKSKEMIASMGNTKYFEL